MINISQSYPEKKKKNTAPSRQAEKINTASWTAIKWPDEPLAGEVRRERPERNGTHQAEKESPVQDPHRSD